MRKKYRSPSVSLCTLLLSALNSGQSAWSLLGRLLLLGQVLDDLLLLGLETLLSALASLLCLETTSFGLIAAGQRLRFRQVCVIKYWAAVHMNWFLQPKCLITTSSAYKRSGRWVWDLRQELLASLVCLQLVNVLHKDALILEHVTLGPQVEAVVPGGQQRGKKTLNNTRILAGVRGMWSLRCPCATKAIDKLPSI